MYLEVYFILYFHYFKNIYLMCMCVPEVLYVGACRGYQIAWN